MDNEYTFTNLTVDSNGLVTLYTGSGTDTETERYRGRNGAVWNHDDRHRHCQERQRRDGLSTVVLTLSRRHGSINQSSANSTHDHPPATPTPQEVAEYVRRDDSVHSPLLNSRGARQCVAERVDNRPPRTLWRGPTLLLPVKLRRVFHRVAPSR